MALAAEIKEVKGPRFCPQDLIFPPKKRRWALKIVQAQDLIFSSLEREEAYQH
jgi:hypothetical protein